MSQKQAAFLAIPLMFQVDDTFFPVGHDFLQSVPNYAVYLLAGILKSDNRPCDIIDWASEPSKPLNEICNILSPYKLVFISINSFNWPVALAVAKRLKENEERIKLCCGGVHPTRYPHHILRSGFFDAVFCGEAETSISNIYDQLLSDSNIHDISGLYYCNSAALSRSKFNIVREDKIDVPLEYIKYDLVPEGIFRCIPVETSRGCKQVCSFCGTPFQNDWRSISAENASQILNHAYNSIDKCTFGKIQVIEDCFTTDHNRILKLCKNLSEEKFNRNLLYDARIVDLLNENLLESLEPFTDSILTGAEVYNIEDAKKIGKPVTPETINEAASKLSKHDLADRTEFSFILGFPWHTFEDCKKLIEFAVRLSLDHGIRVLLQWYIPTPGSRMWRSLERDNKVNIEMIEEIGFFWNPENFLAFRHVTRNDVKDLERLIAIIDLSFQIRDEFPRNRKFFYVGRAPIACVK